MSSCSDFFPFYLASGLFYAKINACWVGGFFFPAWSLPNERRKRNGRFADLHFLGDATTFTLLFFSDMIIVPFVFADRSQRDPEIIWSVYLIESCVDIAVRRMLPSEMKLVR